ncbi:class A beta-lactamase-related serine hydrolase [Bailinhaonella thermotolerans]|uniref:Class A beta-lactamase-related serine hydrolase n=1 Tax=Bailinhaonella thermotolerans TaxID=1070861 RepID=A0A3A4AEB9_9ACTN|nr:serine hydrolase domain-containing protein [Bailinhaonella thermotolerans]RJL26659.1 class A beta-lactamase-related serine hydrolase [Bailinhaonella thermotolerans]
MGGHCDPRFEQVRQTFEDTFERGAEIGAAVAVYLGGELVVDLWGGQRDRHTGEPWEEDTPCLSWSCTKGVTAAVMLMLADKGALDLSAPVADVWPEFGAAGKERITIAEVMSHRAGLPALEGDPPAEEVAEPVRLAERLAAQKPVWEPGTAHGYHALTYGWLLGEVVRRATGRTVGEIVNEDVAPGLEMWLGAPDDVIARTARLSWKERRATTEAPPGLRPGTALYEMAQAAADPDSLMNRALYNPPVHKLPGGFGNPLALRAGVPAAGLVATARGLAGFYRDLLAGRIVAPDTLRDALVPRSQGPDRILYIDSAFGLGFMRPSTTFLLPQGARAGAFGHTGLGGAIGLGDVERGLALAYIPNKMGSSVSGGLRAYNLINAAYASLSS